jgi:oxygen-dependent protoporphyrinogen oxidase
MARRRARAVMRQQSSPLPVESVADWSERVYGPDATRWLIGPALQGIYGAPPDRLAACAIAGLGAGRLGRRSILAAPPHGMSDLTDRMMDRLRQRGVSFSLGLSVGTLDPAVPTIVATNARAAGPLIAPHAPALAAALAALPMTSLSMTTAVFPPSPADIRGFGVLFPRECGIQSLGVRFDSEIFQGRQGRVETWIGPMNEGGGSRLHDPRLPDSVAADRRVLTGRTDDPIAAVTTSRPQSLPLYSAAVAEIRDRLHTLPPWIALAGNYTGRLGASKLLDVAAEAAVRISRYNAVTGSHPSRGLSSRQTDGRLAGTDSIQREIQQRGTH